MMYRYVTGHFRRRIQNYASNVHCNPKSMNRIQSRSRAVDSSRTNNEQRTSVYGFRRTPADPRAHAGLRGSSPICL